MDKQSRTYRPRMLSLFLRNSLSQTALYVHVIRHGSKAFPSKIPSPACFLPAWYAVVHSLTGKSQPLPKNRGHFLEDNALYFEILMNSGADQFRRAIAC